MRNSADAPPVLEGVGLRKAVGDSRTAVLSGVDFRVDAGEVVAVTGASGSGKSTLLNVLGLLDRPTAGEVILDGVSVTRRSERERAQARASLIGFVFQRFYLRETESALANARFGLWYAGVPRNARDEAAADALARVGLAGKEDQRVSTLSGGEQQRVAIARALARGPKALLCDEPTGNLDAGSAAVVRDLLWRQAEDGAAVVVVTHDASLAAQAHRQLHLASGQLVTAGTSPDV